MLFFLLLTQETRRYIEQLVKMYTARDMNVCVFERYVRHETLASLLSFALCLICMCQRLAWTA